MNRLRDPFDVERLRANLAEEKNFTELFKTYTPNYPEIHDENTSQFWDSLNLATKDYQKNYNPMAAHRVKLVTKKITGKNIRVLNVGFGSASLEKEYFSTKREQIEWYGIDIAKESVKNATRLFPNGHFATGTITSINHKDNTFDYVIALEVLEHIPPRRVVSALRELKRVLKKKGTLIVSVPLNEGLEKMVNAGYNPNAHMRVYTPALLSAELSYAGFKVTDVQFLYAFNKQYALKTFLTKISPKPIRLPNNIIVQSVIS